MTLIFIASADAESGPRASRWLGPLLSALVPDLTPAEHERVLLYARKVVHFVTYGVLASLLAWALHGGLRAEWQPRLGRLAVGICLLYAISDEWHQSFVPTRVGSPWDVLIDTLGAVTALIVLRRIGLWRVTR